MAKKSKQAKLFKEWKNHLSNSKLTTEEIIRRAKSLTKKGMQVKNDA
jgi:hypothetical protein